MADAPAYPQAAMPSDRLGVPLETDDRVMVTAWGYGARLVDTGTKSPVVRINRKRVVIIDSDGYERAVGSGVVSVLRRDGAAGFEGNVA